MNKLILYDDKTLGESRDGEAIGRSAHWREFAERYAAKGRLTK